MRNQAIVTGLMCLTHTVPDMVMASTAKTLEIQPSEASKVCFSATYVAYTLLEVQDLDKRINY